MFSYEQIPQVSLAEDIPSQIQMEQKIKKRSNIHSPGQGQSTAATTGTFFFFFFVLNKCEDLHIFEA